MSDPQAPPPAAPPAEPAPAAPQAAAPAPAPEAAKPARVNPYAGARKAPAVAAPPAAPAAQPAPPAAPAPAAEAKPKNSRVLALRDAEIAKLKPLADQNKAYAEALAPIAQEQLKALPESARDKLAKQYKDNPLGLVQEINRLRDLGLLSQPQAQLPGATTAPPKQPAADQSETDPDLRALNYWEEAKRKGMHTTAARHYAKNEAAIRRGQQKIAARN